jgi:hypothetical protein
MTDQPTPVPPPLALNADQRKLLAEAAAYLENPSFLVKVANLVGKPAEVVIKSLPDRARVIVADGTSDALKTGLDWAVRSLPPESSDEVCEKTGVRGFLEKHRHTALTALTGAGGGMMGLPGLAVELPTTTMLMLRSIASIAAEHGADLNDPATRLECLAVFSLGSQPLEEMESAYLTTRLSLAMAVRQATHFVAQHTAREISDALAKGTAPVLMRLISAIAARFQIVVTEKVAAQAVPIVGAGLGALVNASFTDHFNRVARYHFSIVEMERRYGRELVQSAYREACHEEQKKRGVRQGVKLTSG